MNNVGGLLGVVPPRQDLGGVQGGRGGDDEPVHQLGVKEGRHHGHPAPGVEPEDGGLVHLQLVLEVDQVGGHLLHGGVCALGRVPVIPSVRDDDGPLGHVVDLLAQTCVVFFPSKQSMMNYQRTRLILFTCILVGHLQNLMI